MRVRPARGGGDLRHTPLVVAAHAQVLLLVGDADGEAELAVELGAVRIIQTAAPSADTEGNTKRTVTVDITKLAIARLRNA